MNRITPIRKLLLSSILLAACGGIDFGDPGIADIPVEEIPIDLVPQCSGEFEPPVPVFPVNGEVIEPTTPYTFEWGIDCRPRSYILKVFSFPDTLPSDTSGPLFGEENFETAALEWDSSFALEPMTSYEWSLTAIGWDSPSNRAESFRGRGVFTTGPLCDAEELLAPELIYPANGSVYTGKSWGNPFEVEADIVYPSETCIPDGYEIYISETSDFSTPNLNFFSPAPYYTPNSDGLLLVEDDSNDVPDCTTLYWRAWATQGDTSGPYSETFHFYTNIEGPCPIIPPIDFEFIPFIIPIQDTNCRASDFTASQNLATLLKGEFAEILAINPALTHVRIIQPKTETRCWVWLDLVDIQFGYEPVTPDQLRDLIPVQQPPAPPTSPPDSGDGNGSAPAAPSGLGANTVCASPNYHVLLFWNDNADNEQGYRVYRNGQLIATLGANSTKYTDTTPPGSGPQTYYVEAFNGSGAVKSNNTQDQGCIF